MRKKICFTASAVMGLAAVVYVIFALKNPEYALLRGGRLLNALYGLYTAATVLLFFLALFKRSDLDALSVCAAIIILGSVYLLVQSLLTAGADGGSGGYLPVVSGMNIVAVCLNLIRLKKADGRHRGGGA